MTKRVDPAKGAGDRPAFEIDWESQEVKVAEVGKCKSGLARAFTEGYLDRLENAVHLIGASLKEAQGFRPLHVRGLFDAYLEGRARLACYLNVVHGGANRGCLLTFGNPNAEVEELVAVRITEGQDNRRYSLSRDQESVLVNVAQLVQCPEGVARPALIGLHIVDDGVLQRFRKTAEASFGAHLTGKALCIVGEWEPGVFALASDGECERGDDVIQCGSQISDCIADDSFGVAGEIMERLKVVAQSVPILQLDSQSVVVCTEPAIDPGIKVRNVMACAV